MTTWEEIRDEVVGMLADGEPLEDVISKLEKMKNEMAKANLLKAMNDMKKREQTNEEWIKSLDTEQLADVFYMVFHNHADRVLNAFWDKHKDVFKKDMMEWLKQPHTVKE